MRARTSWFRSLTFMFLLVLANSGVAAAQTKWNGGGSNNDWMTGANWVGGVAPVSGSTLQFAGTVRLAPNNNNPSGFTVNGLTFLSGAGAFTIGGNALTSIGNIVNSSTNTQTINNTLTLGASQTWSSATGVLTLGGNVGLGSNTLTLDASTTLNVNGAISGTGGLVKEGNGMAVLAGNNTFSGGLLINDGTLRVSGPGKLGTGVTTVSTGATLDLLSSVSTGSLNLNGGTLTTSAASFYGGNITLSSNSTVSSPTGASFSLSGVISETGGARMLTKTGSGALYLEATNTYSGGTRISAGKLGIDSDANLGSSSGTLTLSGGGTLITPNVNSSTARATTLSGTGGTLEIGCCNFTPTFTHSGVISGSGGLTKAGLGTLILSGLNTYTGTTKIIAGKLQLGTSGAISDTSTVDLAGFNNAESFTTFSLNNLSETIGALSGDAYGTVDLGSGTLTTGGKNSSTTVSAAITGTGSLVKTGTGTMTLTSFFSNYSGGTTINGGAISIDKDVSIGAANGALTLSGGTLQTTGTFSTGRATTLGASGGTFDTSGGTTLTHNGIISGAGALTKKGTGTLVLSGANTYTGATTVNAGTLQLGGSNRISDASLTVNNGATFDLNNFSETVGSLSGGGSVTLGSSTLTTGVDNNSTTFSGIISGAGSLVKTGLGTLTLSSAANSYSGATTVNAGRLQLDNGLSISGGPISIAAGAELAARGIVNRAVGGTGNITATGGLFLGDMLGGGVQFNGTLNVGSNMVLLLGTGESELGGTVNLASNGVLSSQNQAAGIELLAGGFLNATGSSRIDGMFKNNGTVYGPTAAGDLLTFTDDVSGTGSYIGNVLFSDGFNPGASPASVTLQNMYFDNTTLLTMELGGTTLGTEHDHLNITGVATLDGMLVLVLVNEFTPIAGQIFNLFDGLLTGTFDALNLPTLSSGLFWDTSRLYSLGEIAVSNSAAVPEPSTVLLLGVGLIAAYVGKKRYSGGL